MNIELKRMNKKWLVFYTKSRQEKKVRDILLRRGFEVFLPLQKVMRQWSDRKKKVEVPLFNAYIFVTEVATLHALTHISCLTRSIPINVTSQ